MAKLDPRLAPAYSIAQAAHYLKIPAPTVRSWVLGRDYPRQSGKGRFKPVVVTPVDPDHRLSFRNLMLARLGVSTAVIVDRINVGEGAADLVKDYGATSEEIMDALAYERAA